MDIINTKIREELLNHVEANKISEARRLVVAKSVKIEKAKFIDQDNFSITSTISKKGQKQKDAVDIKVEEGKIINYACEKCDNKDGYCEHVIATIFEFSENPQYVKMFAGLQKDEKDNNSDITMYQKSISDDANYKDFRDLINNFYHNENKVNIKKSKKDEIKENQIDIKPRLIFNQANQELKLEILVGKQKMYIVKDIAEFYERIQSKEYYSYGSKLGFMHTIENFSEETKPFLDYVLENAEVINYSKKYAETSVHYNANLKNRYIFFTYKNIDKFFELFNDQVVDYEGPNSKEIKLEDGGPKIEFKLQKINKREYEISLESEINNYILLKGENYYYILADNAKMYRITEEYKETVLKLFNLFKYNFSDTVKFREKELSQFFAIVMPKIKNNIELKDISEEILNRYVPQELYVKLFLDFDAKNNIIADVRFVYGDYDFNPFLEEEAPSVARNFEKEDEIYNMFIDTGFMYDRHNFRLVLTDEEKIYNFLKTEIEEYMQKFEVMATENFKQREIKPPHIGSLGVKIENNLLNIDFSNIDFDLREINEIMKKYKMKKRFHRLKDGSYLNFEEGETLEFIDGISNSMNISYNEIIKGEIKLPVYRSMYVDRLLQEMKNTTITKNEEFDDIVDKIENKEEIQSDLQLPKDLNTKLRNYQKIGFEWLETLDKYKLGGILADDMGLGKTIQLITVIMSYIENTKPKDQKPSIVVCPSSLTLNWENEIKKFAPSLKALVIHGNAFERHTELKKIPKYNIIITSYDLLKRDIDIYKELNFEFKYIIADEAQYIKNNNTQNAKTIKEIKAETKYALTGTPIENSLSELWSIFDFIMPGYLFSYRKFKELFETPIVKEENTTAMKKLKMLIEPFVLRRIKKDVLKELPDKTITILNNEMHDEQLKLYLSYLSNAKKEAKHEIEMNGIEKSQIKILALLMRLRQLCCHPSLFIDGYKGDSSKLNQCLEVIEDAIAAKHKILLFSGYTGMFDILEQELTKRNIKYFKLTGQTKVGERIKLVDEFNQNEEIKIFLISLKAGGTGLNLIGADMVIHYDPWWNLSAENQATDRTYRIGQKRNVQVYKLITKNSIEEKIYELQKKKEKLVDNTLSTKQTFINKLSKDEILNLLK